MLDLLISLLNIGLVNFTSLIGAAIPTQIISVGSMQYSPIHTAQKNYCEYKPVPIDEVKNMLLQHKDTLSAALINSVTTSIKCARNKKLLLHDKLTIIDYSLPSNKKRLWIFDLKKKKLLFHTYVSHGIKSGARNTTFFSNKVNSKATSLGVYTAEKAYFGRHGLSLKLHGKEQSFNDKAYQRAIVMHAAWYMDEGFIKRYGRAGRSWGCPAVPINLIKPIVNTIKGGSFFIVYFPGYQWQTKSKFLSCKNISFVENSMALKKLPDEPEADADARSEIYYLDRNNNNRREEHEPVLVMEASDYEHYFQTQVPLERMIRGQIYKAEYVALNNAELQQLNAPQLRQLNFVIPVVKLSGGRYIGTHFKFIKLGEISSLNSITDPNKTKPTYSINFNNNEIGPLRPSEHFIRWLGL